MKASEVDEENLELELELEFVEILELVGRKGIVENMKIGGR